jgi:hypothetical protein
MTIAFARYVQSWFTSRMTTTSPKSKRESIFEKAERIASDPSRVAVIESDGTDFWVGAVRGDSGWYQAFAIDQAFMDRHGIEGGRVGCRCRAGNRPMLCSHALVAEEMRLRGGGS